MPLSVSFTPDAREHVRAATAWWISNRPAAIDMLAEEMERALARLVHHPYLGTRVRAGIDGDVRCVLLPRTRYLLHYRVLAEQQLIDVIAFWHAERAPTPTPMGR